MPTDTAYRNMLLHRIRVIVKGNMRLNTFLEWFHSNVRQFNRINIYLILTRSSFRRVAHDL